MLKVDYLKADGFEAALRGMRNPLNSWNKSDSYFGLTSIDIDELIDNPDYEEGIIRTFEGKDCYGYINGECASIISIGENDMNLCQRLIKAGPEHAKFLRMINVSLDITAPLYFLKELDTYKIGTIANSCSTMHKIAAKEFTLDDFSHEHLLDLNNNDSGDALFLNETNVRVDGSDLLGLTVNVLNYYRNRYINTKDKRYWWQMIQLLPSSYNQKRTLTLNYAIVRNIISQRQNHKLDEWHQLIDAFKKLPYAKELLFYENMEVEDK